MYGHGGGGSSDAISRDMNSLLYSSTFKHPADGEFAKIKQLISLDPYPNYDHHDHNQQQQDENHGSNHSSLLRYRSTPSSFFSNLLDDNGDEEFPDPVTASSNHQSKAEESYFTGNQQKKSESDARDFLQFESSSSKPERKESAIQNQDLPPPSTAAMHGGSSRRAPNLPPSNNNSSYGYTNQNNLDSASSFRVMDSTSSNLIRQSSSPDGFLSCLTVDNGFGGMKDARKGSSSSSSLNNHISFSLGPSSSSRFLPQIVENESDSTFGSLKRSRDGGLKMPQNGEAGNHIPSLVHHMSLPKTSSEMADVENILHFQQESLVPWKARAKRGFATHPRSIAERVRRTRISERIKRLQELFPNMDKQTNTADMLDMAVEYIKDLQKELQSLNEAQARCKCSSKQLQPGSTM
ncbi:transcription factor bHLH130-like [Cynara cardunculus var. scolymus]|uniref:transcription factor bHLH130-like n=1 Tax=Cynara cardunculus var. scolymus TaxID=59895 RepID=UPI000D628B03|nr:transcription factor bHLH130-like [Cynara cardunculus var. scolymus]